MTPLPEGASSRPGSVRVLVLCLMASMLVVSFNQTVLNTALPTVIAEFGGVELIGWVAAAFLLSATLSMPLVGALADVLDKKMLLLVASGVFLIGTLGGALSSSLWMLIVARLVQGAGGGAVMVLTQTIMAATVPSRERAKYAGAFGSVWAVATTSGVLIGGWLTDGVGWRWVFWGTLTLGVAAMLLSARYIAPTIATGERARPDIAGTALLAVVTTVLVVTTSVRTTEAVTWTSIALGLIAVVALVLVERRAAHPVLPALLFRNRTFVLTTAAGTISSGVASFVVLAYLPTFTEMVLGYTALQAGLLLLPMIIATVTASTLTGIVVSRTGRYILIPTIGACAVCIGLVLLGTLSVHSTPLQVMLPAVLVGAGVGTNVLLLTLLAQNALPARSIGVGTAANNFFRQAGATIGISLIGLLFAQRLQGALHDAIAAQGVPAAQGAQLAMLSPEQFAQLPSDLQAVVANAYATALPPLFLLLAPLAAIAAVMVASVERRPLARG